MAPAEIAGGLVTTLQGIVAARQNIANPVDNSAAYTPSNFANE